MEKLFSTLLAMAMLFSVLAACGSEKEPAASANPGVSSSAPSSETSTTEEKDAFVIGVDAEFTSLSPVTTGTEGSLIFRNGVYETLFVYEEDGTVSPWLAEGYEWKDDTTLIVKLHEGVTFHNGNR